MHTYLIRININDNDYNKNNRATSKSKTTSNNHNILKPKQTYFFALDVRDAATKIFESACGNLMSIVS